MEQMDIPTVIAKGIENMGNPNQSMGAQLQTASILSDNKNAVIDQFGNTVFITIPVRKNKKGMLVAFVVMYNADTPKNMLKNMLDYLAKIKQRKIAVLKFTAENENLMPVAPIIGRRYPMEIRKVKDTGLLFVTVNVQEGR